REKCLPRTPFGKPSEPEVKDRVGLESGPTTIPVAVVATPARTSSVEPEPAATPPKMDPLSCNSICGILEMTSNSLEM
ncbi:hypothetical protein WICPIJ_005335, partial [Wickerhamomyces pijperi]